MRTVALLLAAGSGTRAGGTVPKQFAMLGGRPMLQSSIDVLRAHADEVVLVLPRGIPVIPELRASDLRVVVGGASRRESVANGLAAINAQRVLVHDAARPLLPAAVVARVLSALDDADAAVPVIGVADTLVRDDGEIVPRAGLHRVQTPQGFRVAELRTAHAAWPSDEEATDDAQMVRRLGGRVVLVQGDAMLEKVTYPEDFAIAEARMGWETRSASGFDVHRLELGEELWLGGVLIPHDRGLSGHSDADVALHALTDALLGTIAAGDIGTHFPPSEERWRGASSDRFLAHAAGLIAERGGRIDFVDLTIICEQPKIGPHRADMVERIAGILHVAADRVSLKATTTERLGFTGRGEGIAAQAIATISLPRTSR